MSAGQFTSYIRFSDENPLTLDDCLITKTQFQFVSNLPSFSHSDLVIAHTKRLQAINEGEIEPLEEDSQTSLLFESQLYLNQPVIAPIGVTAAVVDQSYRNGDLSKDQLDSNIENVTAMNLKLDQMRRDKAAAATKKLHFDDNLVYTQADDYFQSAGVTHRNDHHRTDHLTGTVVVVPETSSSQSKEISFSQELSDIVNEGPLAYPLLISSQANTAAAVVASRAKSLAHKAVVVDAVEDSDDSMTKHLDIPSPHSQYVNRWASSKQSSPRITRSQANHENATTSTSATTALRPIQQHKAAADIIHTESVDKPFTALNSLNTRSTPAKATIMSSTNASAAAVAAASVHVEPTPTAEHELDLTNVSKGKITGTT